MKVTLIVLLAIVAVSFADLTPADPGFSLKDTLKLAKKYVKLIEKEGEKAWHFLECMGLDWAEHCVEPTVGCLATKNLAGCVALIACEGKDAKACSSKFK